MEKLIVFLGTIVVIVLISLVLALPVQWLWNWLMPIIFGLVKITTCQALGLTLLCGLLFKAQTSK